MYSDHDQKQFETLAVIRGYAKRILKSNAGDLRPSTAASVRRDIERMSELSKSLDTLS